MNVKNQVAKTTQESKNQQSAEIPQNADKVKEMQQRLDVQIAQAQALHEKITLRDKFMALKKQLHDLQDKAQSEESDVFEGSDFGKITFIRTSYRDDAVLTIKNPSLIAETIGFVTGKVNDKILALEAEILG